MTRHYSVGSDLSGKKKRHKVALATQEALVMFSEKRGLSPICKTDDFAQ
jgi:hypothetical protein